MKFSLNIARRYLFAKKSTNAINIITGISVFGLTIGTAALIIVLSVFNGFEDLLTSLFSDFNPDIKVTPVKGKVFELDEAIIAQLDALEGVQAVSKTLEEVAFFEYDGTQLFGTIKGVDALFERVSELDSSIQEGKYILNYRGQPQAILGSVIARKLGVNLRNDFEDLTVFMAKRKQPKIGSPFRKKFAHPSGIFNIQNDFDSKYIITSLDFTRGLLGYKNEEISALELKLTANADKNDTQSAIKKLLGEDFNVKDRYQQDEAFLKLMNMEKWLYYALFSFMIIIIAFNMIGALWMIVLEKKKDIAILKSMGARDLTIRNIFLNQGLLLSVIGITTGFILAIIVYTLQKTVGIVTIPDGFVVSAYPIELRLSDFIWVGVTVAIIGTIASLPPALKAMQIPAMIREE